MNSRDKQFPKLIRWTEIRGIPKFLRNLFPADEGRITALEAFQAKFFIGAVQSDGTADTPFPTGWSCSNTGTGVYLVTHNIGSATGYVVSATIDDVTQGSIITTERDSNSFDVEITDATGALSNEGFNFVVIKS